MFHVCVCVWQCETLAPREYSRTQKRENSHPRTNKIEITAAARHPWLGCCAPHKIPISVQSARLQACRVHACRLALAGLQSARLQACSHSLTASHSLTSAQMLPVSTIICLSAQAAGSPKFDSTAKTNLNFWLTVLQVCCTLIERNPPPWGGFLFLCSLIHIAGVPNSQALPGGYRDSLLATVREAVTIWYQGIPR